MSVFLLDCLGGVLLVSKLFSGVRWQVKSALMWGGNSSIDPGVSVFRWLMVVHCASFPALPFR